MLQYHNNLHNWKPDAETEIVKWLMLNLNPSVEAEIAKLPMLNLNPNAQHVWVQNVENAMLMLNSNPNVKTETAMQIEQISS